jgi:hypothetical protein
MMRVGVLIGSQQWLHWDECIIGLAAKDVLRGTFYTYFPGSAYGGGAGLESLAIAILFVPLGVSALAVKLYALIVSMVTLVIIVLFVRRAWGWSAAVWSGALWATAPALAVFSLQVRAGYIEIQLLTAIVLYLFHRIAFRPNAGNVHAAVGLGVACGFAYYSFSLAVPLLLAVSVIVVVWDKRFWSRRTWLLALGGFICGLMPMIVYDLRNDFAHLRWALSMGGGSGEELPHLLWRTVSYDLPSFFQHHVDDYFEIVPWYAWPLAGLTGALTLLWLWQARSDLVATTRQSVRMHSRPPRWPAGMHTTMVLFVALYLILYLFGPPQSPRYFLGLYPVLAIGLGVAVADTVARGVRAARISAVAAAAALVLGGLMINIHLMNIPVVRDVLGSPVLREGRVAIEPGGAAQVTSWLLERNIRDVYAHPMVKWKLMFYSDEAIRSTSIFSTSHDDKKMPRYLEDLPDMLNSDRPYAFVFHKSLAYQGTGGGRVGVAGPVAVMGLDERVVKNVWHRLSQILPPDRWPRQPERIVPYLAFFQDALSQSGITWETTVVGDFLIVHDFRGGSAVHVLWRHLKGWQEQGGPRS